ncbi:MAG: BspA family leucine-rich repeat surface protein [Bacilli bacterium]|nr:BspA family leucine-rich repeat surface protein [Bacilli bacterium]
MKKRLLVIIIFSMFFIPTIVSAKDNSCEKISTSTTKTVEIKVKQKIENIENISQEELDKFSFKYKIIDLYNNNNVLDETTMDSEGNVIFNCFTVSDTDLKDYSLYDDSKINDWSYSQNASPQRFIPYRIYKIVMENNEENPFDYDASPIYFSLRSNYTNGLFDPEISFFRDDNDIEDLYNTSFKKKIYHATEEELQKQAYAVLDKNSKTLTFFRDDENKYTNKQEIDNKVYFTGFETIPSTSSSWSDGWRYKSDYTPYIKKIVFKDAIKPNNIIGWFEGLTELEELDLSKLDTSLITKMDYFLFNCQKVKKVDISTFDVSNVTSVFKAFNQTNVEVLEFPFWNLNQNLQRFQMSEFVLDIEGLKYLNISNFGNWSSSAEFSNLPCLEKLVINNVYDFSRTSMRFGGVDNSTIYSPVWYNPEKNQLFSTYQIHYNIYNKVEDMAGAYIRPVCTKEASFKSKYNPSKVKRKIKIVEVDETKELTVELLDTENVEYNETVRFRVIPKIGYTVEKIIIKDIKENLIDYKKTNTENEYEFVMPDSDVSIKPVYKELVIKNPNTGDYFLIIMIMTISALSIRYCTKKEQ